jgi:transcriptional regulator with XRE-family HTH domain
MPITPPQLTGSQLRAARAFAGVRQDALARAAGITTPQLVAFERGYAEPAAAIAERLRSALQELGVALLDNGRIAPLRG